MDIAQMRMMLVLAECKSITTTAKKLHVTQPALTYQLKVIENELGFKVFNRTRVGTSLTAEGAFLHETIKRIVADYDEAVRLGRAMSKGIAASTIRVGINDSSRDSVSFFLNVAQSSLVFSLIPCGSSDPVHLLREEVIDFWSTSDASMANAPRSLRFAELTTASQSAFVPLGHRLANRESIEIADLRDETVWLWPRGSASIGADRIRDQLEQLGTDIVDFIPGVPGIVTAFMDEGVVVYDNGFLPPSTQSAVQIPIADSTPDALGLVYLSSKARRFAPVIENLKQHTPTNLDRTASPSELAAERIVSLLDEISSTVRRGGMKDVVPLIEYGIDLGVSANHLLNRGLLAGMNATNEAYRNGEIFMTEMIASVSTASLAMDTLQPYSASEDEKPVSGTAAIGTVVGDQHDIGKSLVRIMLESRDIQVADLGTEVTPEAFVEYIRNNTSCNLILISINRTEVHDAVRKTIEALQKAKLRDQIFIMIGGAAADQAFADEIGADAFTTSAEEAADKAHEFLSLA